MRDLVLLLPPRHPSPTTRSSAGHDEFNDISGQDEFKDIPGPVGVTSVKGHRRSSTTPEGGGTGGEVFSIIF